MASRTHIVDIGEDRNHTQVENETSRTLLLANANWSGIRLRVWPAGCIVIEVRLVVPPRQTPCS